MAQEVGSAYVTIGAKTDGLKRGLAESKSSMMNFKQIAAGMFAGFTAAGIAQKAMAGITQTIGDSIKAVSDFNETASKARVIFGDAAEGIISDAKGMATAIGQSQQSFVDATATFGVFGKSAGLTGQELASFSTDLVKLSSDMASFSNTTPEDAVLALGAALRGETEPIRRYGVLLDDASIRQKALEMGIVSTTKNALTPQQRVLAAQALIFEQTADAQGDFARTSDGLANQQRILTAELQNLKKELGESLLPTALKVTGTFIDIVQVFNGTYDAAEHAKNGITDLDEAMNLLTHITEGNKAGLWGIGQALKFIGYQAEITGTFFKTMFTSGANAGVTYATLEGIKQKYYGVADATEHWKNKIEEVIPSQEKETAATEEQIEANNSLIATLNLLDEAEEYRKNRIAEHRMLDEARAADELSQKLSDLQDIVSGELGSAMEDFTETQGELGRRMMEVKAEIATAILFYGEESTQVSELKGKYEELAGQYDANATAHEEATKRILWDMLIQRASIDGLSDKEYEVILGVAQNWGLIDEATKNSMLGFDGIIDKLDNPNYSVKQALQDVGGVAEEALGRTIPDNAATAARSQGLNDLMQKTRDIRDNIANSVGLHQVELEMKVSVTGDTGLFELFMNGIPIKKTSGVVPLFHGGADFIVPPGYPNDSFPIMVESGEHVKVTPANQTSNISNNWNMTFQVPQNGNGYQMYQQFRQALEADMRSQGRAGVPYTDY